MSAMPLKAAAFSLMLAAGLNCGSFVAAQEARSSGTGFAVGPTSVLTNAHVVSECRTVEVASVGGETVVASVTARDSRNDLALLTLATARRPYAAFRPTSLRSGDEIVVLGFPYRGLLATDVNVSAGIVSAMAGIRNDTSQLQISAPVQPGNSGGPLLDETGAVAGVVVAKLDALAVAKITGDVPQNINFAIKGEVAQSFLRSHGVQPVLAAEPRSRVSLTDRVQSARPYTYLVTCGSVRSDRAAQRPRPAPPSAREPPSRESGRIIVTSVTLGKSVGPDKRVTAETTTFAIHDTIYASIGTIGVGRSTLAVKWTYLFDTRTVPVRQDVMTIEPTGPATSEFRISKPDGWPTGDYRLQVLQDGEPVALRSFRVQ